MCLSLHTHSSIIVYVVRYIDVGEIRAFSFGAELRKFPGLEERKGGWEKEFRLIKAINLNVISLCTPALLFLSKPTTPNERVNYGFPTFFYLRDLIC